MRAYQKISCKNMINLANPRTFVASIIPVMLGLALCAKLGFCLNLQRSICLVLSCVLLQSAVNTLNDHSDFLKGVDSADDNLEADDNVMVLNNLNPKNVELLGIIYLILGIFLGIVSLKNFNKYTIIIATIGAITVLLYSKGPIPLSYLPVGEIVSGLVMGALIPLGVYSVAAASIDIKILVYSIPLIIGISMIMMTNNGSDIEKDLKAGRYTLAVIVKRQNFVRLYKVLTALWMLSTLMLMYYLAGLMIFILSLVVFIIKRNIIINLFTSNLQPNMRIVHIKYIAKANLIINSTYVLAVALSVLNKVN